jgi:ribosomal protein L7/L12
MSTIIFDELCRQEADLVEKLRILREYKQTFFLEASPTPTPVDTAPKPAQPTDFTKFTVVSKRRTTKKVKVIDKVFKAIAAVGQGKSKDFAAKLVELYPSEYRNKQQKATGDTRYNLTDLLKAGKVEIIEQGKGSLGSTYRIKQ